MTLESGPVPDMVLEAPDIMLEVSRRGVPGSHELTTKP